MIKLSTKGRYGTRLMLNLAQHHRAGDEAVILKSVSEQENISIRYLEQIIIPLKINRLVKSIRGAGGGYSLARNPGQIKLSEILESLEGSFSLVDCCEDPEYCEHYPVCATYEVWKGASEVLKRYFDDISLHDLLLMAEKKKQRRAKGRQKPKR